MNEDATSKPEEGDTGCSDAPHSPFTLPPKKRWQRYRAPWTKILLAREDDLILRLAAASAMRDILDDLTNGVFSD